MLVLTNIFMILKSVVVAIGRLVYLLLVKLYLVIPALYIVALWIASASVPFKLGDYSVLIIIGMALCVGLSVLLVLRRALVDPISKRSRFRRSGVVSTGDMDTRPMNAEEPPAIPYKEREAEEEPAYYEDKKPPVQAEQKANKKSEEKPVYYRTKRDPSLYIAEYPDYMEFYRKSGDKYIFLAKEEKE